MKTILIISVTTLFLQNLMAQEWSQFNQRVDIAKFQGGEFKLTASVRVEGENPKISQARLWARVDKKRGIGFFDNMIKRPIISNEWKEYSIEGPIDEKAEKLIVGGLFFGIGKYYYDNFNLKAKGKTGEWESIEIRNGKFENGDLNGWFFEKKDGFKSNLITKNPFEGKYALLIDGSSQTSYGKFTKLNGLDFYYEVHGQGDTLLLLHGNSQSIKAFDKQIPELSKQLTLIAMDSRAQGYSTDDGQKITYDLMAEDVNALLENLKIKSINILGWSDGGNIGLILAMKHPDKVKKLAIMGANLYCDNTSVQEKIIEDLKKQRDELLNQKVTPDDLRLRMIDLLLNEPKINPDDLKSIQCATLVMAGSKDLIKENHTKLIASKIKNSKLIIFPKGTHYEPQENPDRFNKTVIDFFKEK